MLEKHSTDIDLPRWPTLTYIADTAGLYVGITLAVGLLAFALFLFISKPVLLVVLGLGILIGRFGSEMMDRFSRLIPWHPG